MIIVRSVKDIPSHRNCIGCGECCGPVPVCETEYKRIITFINKNKPKYTRFYEEFKCNGVPYALGQTIKSIVQDTFKIISTNDLI